MKMKHPSVTKILVFLLVAFLLSQIVVDRLLVKNPWANVLQCISPATVRLARLTNGFNISRRMPVTEAFQGKLVDASQVKALAPKGIRSEFEVNRNIGGYGLTVVRNICFRPGGEVVLVNITDGYLNETLSTSPEFRKLWNAGYNSTCGWCQRTTTGLTRDTPLGAKWISGNTAHMIPYLGNVFHNFGERIWPHLVSSNLPLNATTMQPVNHFLIHSFTKWIQQAEEGNHERETFMVQFRVLSEVSPGSDFIVIDSVGQDATVCFERLTLDCSSCDRMSGLLGEQAFSAAILAYREAAFRVFGLEPRPEVSVPPRKLHVVFYGRSDTRRRRVVNTRQVVEYLHAKKLPPLEVLFIDELLVGQKYNQTMAETVSLFSQTDVLVTVHGANTWAAMFLPRGAAVIEIYGPCGPGTWLGDVVKVLDLKHDTESNPWKDRVASPGNTTECQGFDHTPDFTLDLVKLDHAFNKLAIPTGPLDTIPLHWLYDWEKQRYAYISS